MKKGLLTFTILIASTALFAQSDKYIKGMKANLAQFDSAKSTEDFTRVAAAFERIGDAEKTQWLPYYYAALANVTMGFADPKLNKDDIATQADNLLTKAEAIDPKNAEIYLVKSMAATLHMIVDPQSRWQKYGTAVTAARETAKQIEPTNPRIYYLEGQNLMGTPEQFGGGKQKAHGSFVKAAELYASYKPASDISPNWGKNENARMVEQTQ